MNWQIDLHDRALKFLKKNKIKKERIVEILKKALKKFNGENINISIAKLKGKWSGFHRIKIGNLRIIAEFDFDAKRIYVEVIDWRESAYKK